MAWNVLDQLNKNAAAAAVDDTPKARFRTKDISIKKMYSNDANFYSMPDIEQLAQDIFTFGLIENLEVVYAPCEKGDYRITAGERRWRALNMLVEQGHSEFEIATCQIQTPASEDEERLRLIIANAYRNKTAADILEEEKQLKETLQRMKDGGQTIKGYSLDSGRLRDVIADMLKMPATKIAQIESINRHLIPEFTDELKEGRMTFSAAYEISGMSKEAQEEMLVRYRENGLTFKEVKEIKRQQEEKAAAEPIPGQTSLDEYFKDAMNEDGDGAADTDAGNIETDAGNMDVGMDEDADTGPCAEEHEEYADAHPEHITSLCFSCRRYMECTVRSSVCYKCDRYIDKAESEKTAEQRYSEEQDAIDRETRRKLKEQQDDERMQQLPSTNSRERVHEVNLGGMFFEDVMTGRKNFELRKNDRDYRVGDVLELHEYRSGQETGRTISRLIIYVLEDFTGLEEGYCILGLSDTRADDIHRAGDGEKKCVTGKNPYGTCPCCGHNGVKCCAECDDDCNGRCGWYED